MAWQKALSDHEFGSSKYICLNHFTPEDYYVWNDGKRVKLKEGAVPSKFDIFLIEYGDGEDTETEINGNRIDSNHNIRCEMNELKLEYEKLQREKQQLQRQLESQKIVINSRTDHSKQTKNQQAKEIEVLKRQIDSLNKSVHQLQNEKDITFDELNVNKLCYGLFQ